MDLNYFLTLPCTPVQVEVNMGRCSDTSAEPFKGKRFQSGVEIGGQQVEHEDY